MKTNILLIGMPATGKSTLGQLLAEKKGLSFVDVDAIIDGSMGLSGQEILDSFGDDGYGKLEAEALDSIQGNGLVISTGGSAIYQKGAISRLKETALVVHLRANVSSLLARIKDFDQRAIVRAKSLSFADLYAERMPLYEAAADIHFDTDCDGLNAETAVKILICMLDEAPEFSWQANCS